MTSSSTGDPALNAARRERDLAELSGDEDVDLVVIGGGFTGVGVALDAAARGLSVVLIERKDLASGTSSWSSKLAHGGLRYLAKLDVPIAWESAVERGHLMGQIAPHLIRPVQMLLPLHAGVSHVDATMLGAGFAAGDVLRMLARTPKSLLPHPSRVSAADVQQLAPGTAMAGLRGGLLSWDGQLVDDARLVVAIARTAAAHGPASSPMPPPPASRPAGSTSPISSRARAIRSARSSMSTPPASGPIRCPMTSSSPRAKARTCWSGPSASANRASLSRRRCLATSADSCSRCRGMMASS